MRTESLRIVRFGNFELFQARDDRFVDDLHDVRFFAVMQHAICILRTELDDRRLAVLLSISGD